MDRIVVTESEVAQVTPPTAEQPRVQSKLPPPIPTPARLVLAPLVLLLPLLCLAAIVLRVATRGQPPRIRAAWAAYLSSLLIASGLISTIAVAAVLSYAPMPVLVNRAMAELDQRDSFPALPTSHDMNAAELVATLRPMVFMISPPARGWFNKDLLRPSSGIGAGLLLHATPAGYLFATARHVVAEQTASNEQEVLVTSGLGGWTRATVIAEHPGADLALLWLPRQRGEAGFCQPIARGDAVAAGNPVFAIGHPEGLSFTVSNGIVSRVADAQTLQISAPISPGNSGGPVYDDRGRLVGVVSHTVDKGRTPNAENLNFAARADALLSDRGWKFQPQGKDHWQRFAQNDCAIAPAVESSPQAAAGQARTGSGPKK